MSRLKVYGVNVVAGADWPVDTEIAWTIVAAKSLVEASSLMRRAGTRVTTSFLRKYGGAGNPLDVAIATARPGVVFIAPDRGDATAADYRELKP